MRASCDWNDAHVSNEFRLDTRSLNRLLDAVPEKEVSRLLHGAERVSLPRGEVLSRQGEPIVRVHFPLTAVLSLVTTLTDGSTIEISTIGNEGTTAVPVYLGGDSMSNATCLCQIPGESLIMDTESFRAAARQSEPLRSVMDRYVLALLTQVGQAVACNALHTTIERAARWLLTSHDRVRADEFSLTQEFLSYMLGVRRASVTVAARTLQAAGLIRYQHGKITIVDRAGLEEAACECYFVMRSALEEALGPE
jgi:CRP-like cAMP-binding protein